MTMAPAHITPDEYRMYFSQTKNIFDRLAELAIPGTEMKELSMGMSDSYEEAVECGGNNRQSRKRRFRQKSLSSVKSAYFRQFHSAGDRNKFSMPAGTFGIRLSGLVL